LGDPGWYELSVLSARQPTMGRLWAPFFYRFD